MWGSRGARGRLGAAFAASLVLAALLAAPAFAAGPTNTVPPTVSGTAASKGQLVGDPGTWSCGAACSITYSWDRCDLSLAHCYPDGDGEPAEGSPVDWSGVGATVSFDPMHGWSGSGSWRVQTEGKASEQEGLQRRSPLSYVQAGKDNSFSAWVYSDVPQVFRIGWIESPSGAVNTVQVNHPGGGWALLGRRAPIGPTTTSARPVIDVQSASPTVFWVDNLLFSVVNGGPAMGGWTVRPTDVGSRVRMSITVSDGSASTTATAASPQIAPGSHPVNVTPPTLVGSPAAGSTITIQHGTWHDGDQPLRVNAWQFQRCDDRLATCVPTNTNLIGNGDAEAGVGPWKGYGGASVTRDNEHGKAGKWALKVVSDGSADMEGLNLSDAAQAADRYDDDVTVSMWVYSQSWRTFRIGFDMNTTTTGNSYVGNHWAVVGHPGGGWALLSFSARTPAATGMPGQMLYLNPFIDAFPATGPYTIWVDNVEVVRTAAGKADSGVGVDAYMQLNSTDAGSRIRIAEFASNGEFTATAYSDATPEVAGLPDTPPSNTAPPTIAGTTAVGSALTASTGTWSGGPLTFTYLFQRCDTNLERCADIGDIGANLLPNPTLEATADPWKGYSANVVRTNAHGKSGAWAIEIGGLGATAMEGVNLPDASQPQVSGSTVYTFSAWVYSAAPRALRIGFDENETNTGNSFLGNQSRQVEHPGGGWALLSFKGTTKAATRYLNPFIDAYPGAGAYTIWVDDVELLNTTPGPYAAYTPSAADEGSRMRVIVTATNAAGSTSVTSDPSGWITG